jgi:hypothetical protein
VRAAEEEENPYLSIFSCSATPDTNDINNKKILFTFN